MIKHKTQVMATLVPDQCRDTHLLESMLAAGLKGVRINSAYVTPAQLEDMVKALRHNAPGLVILMDTKGPELRTTEVHGGGEFSLAPGASIKVMQGDRPTTSSAVYIPAKGVDACLIPGVQLLLDDGEVCLQMVSHDEATVTKGGVLGGRKSVNMHGCELPPLPAVSDRDRANLEAAGRIGIDIVAHSFVRTADDIRQVREALGAAPIKLLAKIETRMGVENAESILDGCDGLLVARGDLGTQISPFEIPVVQRRCAQLCENAGKEYILATQILTSMMENPQPTRAELSDIALATWQHADWLLLCNETARGKYPVECVRVCSEGIAAASRADGVTPSSSVGVGGEALDNYIAAHVSPEPAHLADLYRHTCLHRLYPRMCSGNVQGRLLKALTSMLAPKRILELGTFTGYSALCMAEGMPADAELHTIEIDDEWEDEIRGRFDASPWASRMRLHIGDALFIVPQLGGQWDMVFIDANKRHYLDYYRMILPMMRPGGFIIADNTLWDGKIAQRPAPTDPQSLGIMAFNDFVAQDPRVEVSILPVRDGMTLIRVL